MTAAKLLASIPIHRPGSGAYVVLAEIAQPWRDQFAAALRGSAAPLIDQGYDVVAITASCAIWSRRATIWSRWGACSPMAAMSRRKRNSRSV